MKAGRSLNGYFKAYLNEVDFVSVGEDSVHPTGHLLPRSGDQEGVKAVPNGVQAHVDRACKDSTVF